MFPSRERQRAVLSILCQSMRILLLALPLALAAQTGPWSTVTKSGYGFFHEPGLWRTSDGVLHVVWTEMDESERFSFSYRTYAPQGQPPGPAVDGPARKWTSLTNPVLVPGPSGVLTLVFSGVQGEGPKEQLFNQGGLYTSVRAPGAAGFVLEDREGARLRTAWPGPIGAAVAPDGGIWTGWPVNAGFFLQRGFDKPEMIDLADATCCTAMGQLAADAATGEVWGAWYSTARAHVGLMVRKAAPERGVILPVPGAFGEVYGQEVIRPLEQQLAFRGRGEGPGVFLAWCHGYPACTEIRLWQPGGAAPITLTRSLALKGPALSAAPEGRLWVMWIDRGSVPTVVRSNRAVTRFSKPITVPFTASALPLKINGEGSAGPLDLFVSAAGALYQTHIVPSFDVVATPLSVSGSAGGTFKVTVTDLGDPVSGAKLELGDLTAVTAADGQAQLIVPPGRKPALLQLKVTHEAYKSATSYLTLTR